MNKEVNFETAKLLKEKGFEGAKSPLWYYKDGTLHETPTVGYKGLKCWNTWDATQGIRWDAPTIAEVVMWLYEKHGIWVYAVKTKYGWLGCVKDYSNEESKTIYTTHSERMFLSAENDTWYNLPTEAYEAGIIYTLENLT